MYVSIYLSLLCMLMYRGFALYIFYIPIYFSKVLRDRTIVSKWNMKVGIAVVEFKFFSLNCINSGMTVECWTSGLPLFFFHSVWTRSGSEFWERHVVSGTTKLLAPTPFSPCKWPANWHVVRGTTKLLAPTPFSPCKWPSNWHVKE